MKQVKTLKQVPLVLLFQLLGKMISCLAIVPWVRLHSRPLQWLLLPSQRASLSNAIASIKVPLGVLRSLEWWNPTAMEKCGFLKEPNHLVLTTDTSLFGWGARLLAQMTQGRWSPKDLLNDINWVELRAAHLAL